MSFYLAVLIYFWVVVKSYRSKICDEQRGVLPQTQVVQTTHVVMQNNGPTRLANHPMNQPMHQPINAYGQPVVPPATNIEIHKSVQHM